MMHDGKISTIIGKVILKEGWGFIGVHRVNHRYII